MDICDIISQLMSISKGRNEDKETYLLDMLSTSDYPVRDMQDEFDRTLRLNILTRNDLKVRIVKILIEKINNKNNKAEFFNPKIAMKSKVRTFEELLEVTAGSQYDDILR
jgi:hypothetical protein